ncbi:MAG: hypothetical protein JSU09_06305 [Bacteroidetes bacterium]|nr:hypothetical protein [Bacteroidota bacterium]
MNLNFLFVLFFSYWAPRGNIIADGYVDKLSVHVGDSLTVFLNAYKAQDDFVLRLYDLKGNAVARYKVAVTPQERRKDKPWENGFGYKPTLKIKVPPLKSGVYLWNDEIPFVVKSTKAKIIVVYSSNTENAYCNAGGKSLYAFNSTEKKPAAIVSFLRPIPLPRHSEAFLKWFCKQNYSEVGYITDSDLDSFDEIKNAKLLMIVGHSEYWTLDARRNFDRFVDEGKNALVLSGNTMWWQVRYDKNKSQLIGYKDYPDPEPNVCLHTTRWNEQQLGYPIVNSIGADFAHAGYGLKQDKGWDGYKIVNAKSPLLRGIRLKNGEVLKLSSDENDGAPLLGYEQGRPIIDQSQLGFEKIELIGYDSTFRINPGVATWMVFKKTKKSGIVINTASTDWCSHRGMGSNEIKKITLNMINKLLRNETVFTAEEK